MPNGTCGVISFGVPGGREKVSAFLDHLKMVSIATHVADARSCTLYPAGTTHRQLTEEQLERGRRGRGPGAAELRHRERRTTSSPTSSRRWTRCSDSREPRDHTVTVGPATGNDPVAGPTISDSRTVPIPRKSSPLSYAAAGIG